MNSGDNRNGKRAPNNNNNNFFNSSSKACHTLIGLWAKFEWKPNNVNEKTTITIITENVSKQIEKCINVHGKGHRLVYNRMHIHDIFVDSQSNQIHWETHTQIRMGQKKAEQTHSRWCCVVSSLYCIDCQERKSTIKRILPIWRTNPRSFSPITNIKHNMFWLIFQFCKIIYSIAGDRHAILAIEIFVFYGQNIYCLCNKNDNNIPVICK